MTPALDAVLADIQHLKKAAKLLDSLLGRYDVDTGEIKFPTQREWQQFLKRLSPENQARARHPLAKLADEIEEYKQSRDEVF